MALYQLYLSVIPKIGLLKLHDEVPEKIILEKQVKYFEPTLQKYWRELAVDPETITQQLDLLLDRNKKYSNVERVIWKTETKLVDNDVWMSINQGKIDGLSFRADLREEKLWFLTNMIQLGKDHDWVFVDLHGSTALPLFEKIKALIYRSEYYHFLKDPKKYLEKFRPKRKDTSS